MTNNYMDSTFEFNNEKELFAKYDNKYGQLGVGSEDKYIDTPLKVLIDEKIKDYTYIYHCITYFITITDKLYACGNNTDGILGIGLEKININTPQKVMIDEKIIKIKPHSDIMYYIAESGSVYVSGKDMSTPIKININEKITKIKNLHNIIYFITQSGLIYKHTTLNNVELTDKDYSNFKSKNLFVFHTYKVINNRTQVIPDCFEYPDDCPPDWFYVGMGTTDIVNKVNTNKYQFEEQYTGPIKYEQQMREYLSKIFDNFVKDNIIECYYITDKYIYH